MLLEKKSICYQVAFWNGYFKNSYIFWNFHLNIFTTISIESLLVNLLFPSVYWIFQSVLFQMYFQQHIFKIILLNLLLKKKCFFNRKREKIISLILKQKCIIMCGLKMLFSKEYLLPLHPAERIFLAAGKFSRWCGAETICI